jgi:hypothetical protein
LLPFLRPGYAYRFIFMERDICEVLASQHRMLERLARSGTDVSDQSLATVFGKQLARAKTFAREKFGDQILSIDYRATIHDAAAAARSVASFLGRDDLDIDAMVAVVDSHLYHERVSRLRWDAPVLRAATDSRRSI